MASNTPNFVAFLSVITEGTKEANSILESYRDLLKTQVRGQKTVIRRDRLEPAITEYFNKLNPDLKFRPGKGSESDLISQGSSTFNIDIKAKERLDVGSGIKIGGKAIQVSEIASQLEAVRNILATNKLGIMADILERELADDMITKNRLIKYLEIRKPTLPYEVRNDPRSKAPGAFDIYQRTDSGKTKKIDSKKLIRDILDLMDYEIGEVSALDFRNTLASSSIGILDEELITYITKKEVVKKVKGDPTIDKIVNYLTSMKTDSLLDYLKTKQNPIYESLKAKSQNILVMYPKDNKVGSLLISQISFTGDNWFNSSNFYMKIKNETSSSITFYPYIRRGIERQIINRLKNSAFQAAQTQIVTNLENFEKAVATSAKVNVNVGNNRTITGNIGNLNGEFPIRIMGKENLPPGSIPQGSVKSKIPEINIQRRKNSAFNSRIQSVRSILRESKPATKPMGDFITSDVITQLTRREMLRRMPIGPVGGPPLSSRVLTYRTGNFVNSVQVFRDMKVDQISYYYSPNYFRHEITSRNPRNLIESSINNVTRTLFNRRFNLLKENREG